MASVVSQPLTLELSTTLELAETSALDYYAWYVVPFEGENYLVLIGHHLMPEVPGGLLLTVGHLNQATAVYRFRCNRLSQLITDLGVPSIVSVTE